MRNCIQRCLLPGILELSERVIFERCSFRKIAWNFRVVLKINIFYEKFKSYNLTNAEKEVIKHGVKTMLYSMVLIKLRIIFCRSVYIAFQPASLWPSFCKLTMWLTTS